MRFRAKFVQGSWIYLLIGGMWTAWALVHIFSVRKSQFELIGWVAPISGVLLFFTQYAYHWEVDTHGLRQRDLWMNTRIEWQDVRRVVSLWSGPFDIKIEYNRHGFGSKIGRILANPHDHERFMATLRRFAPQAEYVDESSQKTLPI